MRMGSVLIPRKTRNESIGERIAPTEFWIHAIRWESSSRVVTTHPPTLSLWPFKNFVVE